MTGYTPQGLQGTLLGILLINTSTSTVTNNIIRGVESYEELNGVLCAGIYVKGGNLNIIAENKLENNGIHMLFSETTNNLITRNNVTVSSNVKGMNRSGIVFQEASNNIIYNNNFLNLLGDFGRLAKVSYSINTWNKGYPFGGNSWSDYQTRYPNATEIDSSGIGNTPYLIDAQNQDQYPLMTPSTTLIPSPSPTVPEFPLLAILSLFFVITLTSVLILTFGKRKNKS